MLHLHKIINNINLFDINIQMDIKIKTKEMLGYYDLIDNIDNYRNEFKDYIKEI